MQGDEIYTDTGKEELIENGAGLLFDNFMEICLFRHSIRKYSSQVIDDQLIDNILKAVQSAPSAGNLQAFEIVMAKDPSIRKSLAGAALGQSFVAKAPVVLVFLALPGVSSRRYGGRGANLYCLQDATIACTYAMLAASALGLSTAWVGAFRDNEVRDILNIGEDRFPIALLTLGYRDEEPHSTPRRPVQKIAWEI
ncbi:MAG: nitroreductase family protein [Bacillota bacterium]